MKTTTTQLLQRAAVRRENCPRWFRHLRAQLAAALWTSRLLAARRVRPIGWRSFY
jgi:hypothetical protein